MFNIQNIDSYEKALSYFILKLEKTNYEKIDNLDVSNLNSSEFTNFLLYYCNIGVTLSDFNYGINFTIPFDQNNYLNSNGDFYQSILSKPIEDDLVDLPFPLFQSIYTFIPLASPPTIINDIEKYIVWLAYQCQKGGASISITHHTEYPNDLSDFLIQSRNLKLLQTKADYLNNDNFPLYSNQINKAYLNINHIFNIDKNYLFRYSNFSNSILPELEDNPQIKKNVPIIGKNIKKLSILDKKYKVIKPLEIKLKLELEFSSKESVARIKRQFADFALDFQHNVSEGKVKHNVTFEFGFESNSTFATRQFSNFLYSQKYSVSNGKLLYKLTYNFEYDITNSNKNIEDFHYNINYLPLKQYLYKNLIKGKELWQ